MHTAQSNGSLHREKFFCFPFMPEHLREVSVEIFA